MLKIGELIGRTRKKKGMTQQELSEGIISNATLSKIENGFTEPDIFVLNALLRRLGKTLQPFEIVVSNKEFELLFQKQNSDGIKTTVVSEGVFYKDIREAMGLSQEQFCSGICARETISKIEHGRTMQAKSIHMLQEEFGGIIQKYYGYVIAPDYEVYELVEKYQQKRKSFPEEAKYLLEEIRARIEVELPVNRQFLESSELMEKRRKNMITMGEELAGLEQCLRYTMPEYDRNIYRIPYRQEVVILEEIIRCMKRLKKPEMAMQLIKKLEDKQNKKLYLL